MNSPSQIFLHYPRIAERVFQRPWMIQAAAYDLIVQRLEAFAVSPTPPRNERTEITEASLNGEMVSPHTIVSAAGMNTRAGEWMVNDRNRRAAIPYNMDTATRIGQVNICGIIGKGLSAMEMSCGGVCLDHVQAAVQHLGDLGAQKIALHISSPGGACTGVPECAAFLSAFNENAVPIHAFTDTLCCSAGYYLGAGVSSFTASPSSTIGSIGVYCALLDRSGEWARLGRKTHLVTSGKYKGQGTPGVPIDPDLVTNMQAEVDSLARDFFEHVVNHRRQQFIDEASQKKIAPEDHARDVLQGRDWLTQNAPRCLFDALLPNRAAHLTEMARAR